MWDFDDLDAFFKDFGEPAVLKWDYREIDVIFFNSTTDIHLLEELNEDSNPFVLAKTSDISDIPHESGTVIQVIINDVNYNILDVEPDGTGFSKITLKKINYAD